MAARLGSMFAGFDERRIQTSKSWLHARVGGAGPPLLLLHGFPETHLMWREVAPLLASDFTTFCFDLRGQGESGCPESDVQHRPYSKRVMAYELIEAMKSMGFDRFAVAGHDRGGRVAYRMALDHPASVTRLAVLDIIPIIEAWDKADSRLALAFWPWSLMAQPEPLPERLIGGSPDAVIDDAVSQWGTPVNRIPAEIRAAYARSLSDPRHVHAICEEFRSAASLDREDDEVDRQAGRRIKCPLLILWDREGALAKWYEAEGGPTGIWRNWADDITGKPMDGGHFFPEASPEKTAEELRSFLHGDS
ncbi:MAG: alpha/beta fold hydrolase [Sphingomicrobium sp.]